MDIQYGREGVQIDLAEYLFTRLYQVGVRSVHGVPGDYNLVSLDYIKPAGLHLVGNANELNAGYAADGYARIKGISALVTAYGVGELSAINAIGGAFAERAPVVHVVGTPATTAQNSRRILHHSLGDGNFRVFAKIYQNLTCAQANLTDPKTAPEEIDRVIQECLIERRPVYIELPADLVRAKVSSLRLKQLLEVPSIENCPIREAHIVEEIIKRLQTTKKPTIIVDGFTRQYDLVDEVNMFVFSTVYPTYTTPFGKGCIDEIHNNFHGTYMGKAGKVLHVDWVNCSDLVIRFGPLDTDTNMYGFTTLTSRKVTIDVNETSINMQGVLYDNFNTKALFQKLLERIYPLEDVLPPIPYPEYLGTPRKERSALSHPMADGAIDQETFWMRSGGQGLILTPQAKLINSALWLSIGYALAASVGVALAQREMEVKDGIPAARIILFEGDGSFQMTAQAISDVFRNRLNLTIFLINNNGYTIERHIHGMTASYNDIQPWNYLDSPHFFGAPKDDLSYPVFIRRVVNWGQLLEVLEDKQFKQGKGFNMVEVAMGQQDAPESLKGLVRLVCEK
ncbi:pyruvate decarboxylase [Talaromyces islandicus]|uniref:Pyruvate decarboxylase n=1 Tax=Talaromyces islandicus TaxID=28573 RepID=A0A0U1LYC5_TALIS|nr:pyruvate decarboxylase [Talaromyces islandicus]